MSSPSTLDFALRFAEQGFYLFPLKPNSKTPAIKGWQAKASRDPGQLEQWFDGNSYNLGLYTGKFRDGQTLLVVDIDCGNGKPGIETWEKLDTLYGPIPETFETRTASGGRHYIFATETPCKQGANTLGPGIDTRAKGGYVVAPGSAINGKPYQLVNAADPKPCPPWIRDKLGNDRTREDLKQQDTKTSNLDREANVKRAIAWLTGPAPVAVEGSGGDHTTFSVAAKVKDFGISQKKCLDLLLEHWNDSCEPPWDPDDLKRKVTNAYRYAQAKPGSIDPRSEFGEVADAAPEKKKTKKKRLYFIKPAQIAPQLNDIHLVKGLLGQNAMSVIYGESNSGKTFLMLDVAFHVATGKPWNGRRVEKGLAVYVAAEAGNSTQNRIEALKRYYRTADFPLALVPCQVDLLRPNADAKPLVALVKEAEQAFQTRAKMIVIDTLSRVLAGGNENAPEDMGALVKHLDYVRNTTGAHLAVVHHTGKDQSKGARGHSLLRAATDTEIEIKDFLAYATKQRDMEPSAPVGFDLVQVKLGTNAYEEPVTSCVVKTFDPSTRNEFLNLDLNKTERALFESFNRFGRDRVKTGELLTAFRTRKPYRSKSVRQQKKDFSRGLTGLLQKEMLVQDGETLKKSGS